MVMNKDERLFVAAAAAFLEDTVLPARRPGYQRPDYWTLPLTRTVIQDVAPTLPGQFTDLITIEPPDNYQSVINKFVATTIPAPDVIGLTPATFGFRFIDEKGLEPFINLDIRSNYHYDTEFPLVRRKTWIIQTDTDVAKLQVFNLTGAPVRVAAALLGWQWYDPDASGELSESIVDA